MSITPGATGFSFNEAGITGNAPNASGVYALYNTGWVYFGESNDIQRRLLEHLRNPGILVALAAPTGFVFELVPAQLRVGRQNELIRLYPPLCNQRLG